MIGSVRRGPDPHDPRQPGDGGEYIFEKPIRADYAFILAYGANRMGSLVYKGIYRSNEPAMAARVTIVEVEEADSHYYDA